MKQSAGTAGGALRQAAAQQRGCTLLLPFFNCKEGEKESSARKKGLEGANYIQLKHLKIQGTPVRNLGVTSSHSDVSHFAAVLAWGLLQPHPTFPAESPLWASELWRDLTTPQTFFRKTSGPH